MNATPLSWSRLERILSGRDAGPLHAVAVGEGNRVHRLDATLDGSRAECIKPAVEYAELHACSAYNFLRGASEPEEMVARAAEFGMSYLACVDRDGFYGAARFAAAAASGGVETVFGAELSLHGAGRPPLLVLCRGSQGYRGLSRLIARAQMESREKGVVDYPPLEQWGDYARADDGECQWYFVVGWNNREIVDTLVHLFGAEKCLIELQQTLLPAEADHNAVLHDIAQRYGLREIATALPTCAGPDRARLAGVKHALHDRQDLSTAEPLTHPLGGSWLRSGEEMLQLAGDNTWLAAAVRATVDIARECAFTFNLIAPNLPRFPVPDGHTEMSWLRELTERGATIRYGARPGPRGRSGGDMPHRGEVSANYTAWETIDKELRTIEELGFPGYFLIVHDIVSFCHSNNILCQGRGSAANSAVCFALGITNVDAVAAGLLFERFLSPERDGPPDIDVDIESGRREEAIQYVYSRYGRENAAQVANVITYRRKGALRDAARALGYAPGRVDAWSRGTSEPPELVTHVAEQLTGQPRHLGIHSGGMVICDRPITDVVPIEWARMDNRSIVQWDKDDCATVGLVKFDLLGLGMLEAIHHAIDQVRTHRGREVELWRLDPIEKDVYDMLSRADAVGVFQVESRAQMSTLPRLKPRTFYDLVVEVALIRPGPIQGGSVHPYIRRRNGLEPVTFEHPCLEPALTKTLGVPLFQEQLMQVAVDAAGFSGAEADSLRRAMGSKRSPEKMEQLRQRFFQGLETTNGIVGDVADRLWDKIIAFASYGFPESHAQSFASLVYYSAWFKYHYPAEFCVALLRAQPMGFYSPQSLISDARRHGVRILPVDVNESGVQADADIPTPPAEPNTPRGVHGLGRGSAEPIGAIRLGLAAIQGIGEDVARRIVDVRERRGAYRTISDLSREAGLTVAHVEQLARAGALDSLGISRRQAVWAAGIAATEQPGMLPGTTQLAAPALPGMSSFELAAADLAATGMTPAGHPVELLRGFLDGWHTRPILTGAAAGRIRGGAAVVASDKLLAVPDGTRIRVAGVITHRQRPVTAGGVVFFGLEDEAGLANIVVTQGLWTTQRHVALNSRLVVIRGIVRNAEGAATVTADLIEPIEDELVAAGLRHAEKLGQKSRDFR